jgi:cellulose synthase (UDP-forming)
MAKRPHAARSGLRPADARATYFLLSALTMGALALLALYASVRLATAIAAADYSPADAVMAIALLMAELFLTVHGIGYFGSMLKAARLAYESPAPLFSAPATAPVALLVASFNESPEVLEETLASILAMDYPSVRVYLLDDSTNDEARRGAEELAARLQITLVRRATRAGYKAGAINDVLPRLDEPYVAILDADQCPSASWLKDVVPLLEADPTVAFVQVPQVYVNTQGLPVAYAAKFQQAIFFEYICEGKSRSNAMFCCGSNVVLRRSALMAIEKQVNGRRHFFDETSVTEDFATSIRLHAAGWKSMYLNRTYVTGMGPETLPAYFTQQKRWAMGTMGAGLRLLLRIVKHPGLLRPAQWWEYSLSGTYYFVGWANLVFMAAPIAFMAFNVRPLRGYAELYLLVFIPYVAFTVNLVYYGMRLRGYPVKGIWLASALSFCTFWIYIKASLVAVFGLKRAFGVTPKGVGGAMPLRAMVPELIMLAGNSATAVAGLVLMGRDGPSVAYVVNTFWASYHALLLSMLFFYLNRPVAIPALRQVFAPALALDSRATGQSTS